MAFYSGSAAEYYQNLQNQIMNNQPTFSKSSQTLDDYNSLTNLENNKPQDYRSRYQGTISDLTDKYQNNKFDYDVNRDPEYMTLQDKYTNDGKNAMQDTMGNYAANTGGYSNSYAQAAGQKKYNSYMEGLANEVTGLQKKAYNRFQQDKADTLTQIGLLQGLDDTDYARYRDTMSDYFSFLDYYNNKYSSDLNFDLQKFQQELSNWQSKLGSAQSAYQYENSNDINNYQYEKTFNQQQAQYNADMQYNYQKLLQEKEQFDKDLAYKYSMLGGK